MKKLSLLLLFLTAFIFAKAQEAPFIKEIQNFKKKDSVQFPPKKAVLFVGSSTFTKWTDVQDYFPKHVIINRGFGGSSLPHVIDYAKDIIYPYHAKQVVIYCGENDFGDPGVTAQIVADRVKKLFDLIRENDPKVHIAYISIKPSPSREKNVPKMKEANAKIVEIIKGMKYAQFINTADMLHMNAKGYAIWQKIMEPYLK